MQRMLKRLLTFVLVGFLAMGCLLSGVSAEETATPAPTETIAPAEDAEPTEDGENAEDGEDTEDGELTSEMPLGAADIQVQAQLQAQALSEQNRMLFEQAGTPEQQTDFYADFHFDGMRLLSGIFSAVSQYIEIPAYAEPKSAILWVDYTASDLVLENYSSLTFYINSVPFYSCQVSTGQENVLYLEVPVSLLQSGYNLLEVYGYVRLTNDEGCMDDYNGANWVRIEESTCLRLYYDVVENDSEIGFYPYPFISMMDKTGANAAVAISDAADVGEVEASLMVMADMGAQVSDQNEIQYGKISDVSRENIIYFGLIDNTPQSILDMVQVDQLPSSSAALIQRVDAEDGRYLIVLAQDGEALVEAARMLCDDSRVEQLHRTYATVAIGDSALLMSNEQQSTAALDGEYTLTDILGHGASFTGPFHQTVTLYLPVAEDYTLSGESRFTLRIRYSENLDFDRSLMTVYWGTDVPLSSHKLTAEGAAGETISFAVPADAAGTSGNSMTIAFDLEVKDLDCTPRQLNMPWAYVSEDSSFYLAAGDQSALSLANRPAPFQRGSLLNNVMVVLSDDPTAGELLLLGRTMSMLGSGSRPYGTLEVIKASSFDAANADGNLLVVDQGQNNGVMAQLTGALHFPYRTDINAIASNERLLMTDDYARQVGTVQLFASPFAENRAVLVLTAPEASGMEALADLVSIEENRWKLLGDAVVIDAYENITDYTFAAATAQAVTGSAAPTFTSVVLENREPMIFMLVGLGCMLLALLGVILVLARVRRERKRGEE